MDLGKIGSKVFGEHNDPPDPDNLPVDERVRDNRVGEEVEPDPRGYTPPSPDEAEYRDDGDREDR